MYSVDQSLLGLPCGPTQGGTLFTVDVTSLAGDGAGNITIVSSSVRDCSNLPLPAQPGPPARLVVNLTPPGAISDLGATQVTSGNGPGSTTGITVTWTAPAPGGISLYRAPFGSYPEYDDGGGTLPSSATAPGAPWTLVSASASPGIVDHPPVRGSWHYVAFLTDSCGNRSAVSNRTLGSLNYHLGDVVNGITRGTGDNQVGLGDISLLGAHYGISGATLVSADVAYLDVGPTIDGASTSRPATDDVIDFEDLIVFGINYNLASSPAAAGESAPAPVVSGRGETFELAAPSLVSTGDAVNAVLHLAAAGGMQGFSARLAWDPTVLEALGVTSAGFVERLGGVTFSPRTGELDATLLGVRDSGMRGAGDVATFRFRVLREGDPALRIASVIARDSRNRALDPGSLERAMVAAVPARTLLLAPSPNPAHGCTALAFALAQRGSAELAMYSVDGRRVRTLASGPCEAGEYRITWKGDDDEGRTQTPGVYWARLTAAGRTMTRRVLFLR